MIVTLGVLTIPLLIGLAAAASHYTPAPTSKADDIAPVLSLTNPRNGVVLGGASEVTLSGNVFDSHTLEQVKDVASQCTSPAPLWQSP